MAFTTLTMTQNQFLEQHLRGTGRTISAKQASSLYGIKNIRARATELRQAGLRVRTDVNTAGQTTYAISERSVSGSRKVVFAL
jgi:hypothetical protein